MPFLRPFLGILGICIASCSALFVVAAIGDLTSGSEKTPPGVLIGLAICFVGLTMAGIWMAKTNLGKPSIPKLSAFEKEQRILDLVKRNTGHLTASEAALGCKMSIDESQQALDKMVLQGVAEQHITDHGTIVYLFPGFEDSAL